MTTVPSSENTVTVTQDSHPQMTSNTTAVAGQGVQQHFIPATQSHGDVIYQGGVPPAGQVVLQGTPLNMNTTPMLIGGTNQNINTTPIMIGGTNQNMNTTTMMMGATTQNINTTPMTIQGDYPQSNQRSTDEEVFPVRTFKILGGIQTGLGVLLCILSLVGAIIDGVHMKQAKSCLYNYNYHWDYHGDYHPCYYGYMNGNVTALFAFDVTCLILAAWFILTGFLPMCMSRKRKNSWRCLKIAFMVCSIIGASVFVPTVFSLGVTGSIIRNLRQATGKTVVLSAFIAVLSFAEVVIAIVSASYCCCCTKWNTNNSDQQGFVYIGGNNPHLIMIPQSQIPGTNMQPVVMTYREQQYTVNQPLLQSPSNGDMPQASASNVSMNPPPYKE